MEVKFIIPNDKIQRVVNAMKGLYTIPTDKGEPLFTDNEWAKEALRRIVVRDVRRYETMIAQKEAVVEEDNDIIS